MIYKLKGNHIKFIMRRYTGINNPKLIAKRQPIEPVVMGITGIRIALKKVRSPLRIALVHILCPQEAHPENTSDTSSKKLRPSFLVHS